MVVTTFLSLAYVLIASVLRYEVRTFNFKKSLKIPKW